MDTNPKITKHAMEVLEERYLRRGDDNEVNETVSEMFLRVAKHLTKDSLKIKCYYEIMNNLDFLPNTPTLINAGREEGQLSACFVLPIEDSIEGIFNTIKQAALIHKTGGGTGFSFSRLRSKGQPVKSTGREASGVISFLNVFNAATESIKQGGVRRGANMGVLRVDHPDIIEFVMCKDDPTKLTNFNLSIGITDAFMEAVETKSKWDLIDPHSKEIIQTVHAPYLWDMIVGQAWKNGEPGLLFLDEINRHNPTPELGEIESTNPCGEQPLLPYESCNLGSINLANHVTVDENGNTVFDWEKLGYTIRTAVEFLNDVIDTNYFPLPEIKERTLQTRKIGLGVMGFADMLLKFKIPYGSLKAVKMGQDIMNDIEYLSSLYSRVLEFNNKALTTVAPTGSISMFANVSSGIEPNFSWVYDRVTCDRTYRIVHPLMEEKLRELDLYNDDVLDKLAKGIPVNALPELGALGDYWVTSQELSPAMHITMQAVFQHGVDSAVSKTINLASDASVTDVAEAYKTAYRLKCKGITVYRDGSRANQVLNHVEEKEPATCNEFVCMTCG